MALMSSSPRPRTSSRFASSFGQWPSIVVGPMRASSTTSSATSPCPREISSRPSSLLPSPDSPVIRMPTPSTSISTPCIVVRSASVFARYERSVSMIVDRRLRRGDQRDPGVLAGRRGSRRTGVTAVAEDDRRRRTLGQVLQPVRAAPVRQRREVVELAAADDLDAVRMDQVVVADQVGRRRGVASLSALSAIACASGSTSTASSTIQDRPSASRLSSKSLRTVDIRRSGDRSGRGPERLPFDQQAMDAGARRSPPSTTRERPGRTASARARTGSRDAPAWPARAPSGRRGSRPGGRRAHRTGSGRPGG